MAFVYRWACDRFGHWGGVLAVAVMAWDPNMIAHSQLNTTDLGVTLFAFACMFCVSRLMRRFSWALLFAAGALAGAAMAAKASGVMVLPVVVALLAWPRVRASGTAWSMRRRGLPAAHAASPSLDTGAAWARNAVVVAAVALLTLWASYGFEWSVLPGVPYPVPLASHIQALLNLQSQSRFLTFLCGVRRQGGWWWYFPFAFVTKTPVPLMLALGAALVTSIRQPRQAEWEGRVLGLFPLVYVVVSLASGMNIGYRHLLPAFPFVYVTIGRLGLRVFGGLGSSWGWGTRAGCLGLGLWYVASTMAVYPFALAYFNELLGGPANGYHYLADSNVDWGQSFKALRAYLSQARVGWVWSSHYTWTDPAAYGVAYRPLPPVPQAGSGLSRPYDPLPGVYAISATTLQGLVVTDPNTFKWFRHREPTAQPGYGLLVYHVLPHSPPAAWVAQCPMAQAPLTSDVIRRGFGRDDLRQIGFDCTTSWVYPRGGRLSGWYGLSWDTWEKGEVFLQAHLPPAHLTYEQAHPGSVPAFALFEWDGTDAVPREETRTEARIAPPDWGPARVEAELLPYSGPIALDGPLTFVGYQFFVPVRGTLELWTAWQVSSTLSRPLSLMAHVVGADSKPLAVADGLGFPIEQWHAGDIIVQRHRLTVPGTTPRGPMWLQSSAYWLDTMERWHVLGNQEPTGDRLLLARIDLGD